MLYGKTEEIPSGYTKMLCSKTEETVCVVCSSAEQKMCCQSEMRNTLLFLHSNIGLGYHGEKGWPAEWSRTVRGPA